MSDAGKAVFLSYASQDAEAARRICEALRAAGVEVWFDQSELVGGDVWDQKIRKQIKDCALFVPVISANTQARAEGYFRLEWRLADQRTHLMGRAKAFLLPVCIDDTKDADADVPDSFMAVQWMRLNGGIADGVFCARVAALLRGDASARGSTTDPDSSPSTAAEPQRRSGTLKSALIAATVLVLVAFGAVLWYRNVAGPPSTPAASPTRELVAKAWALVNRPEVARAELDAAEMLCRQAIALDASDADAWAAASYIDSWYVWFRFDESPARREAAREKSARALRLAPDGYESRLAHLQYLVRGTVSSSDANRALAKGGEAELLAGRLLRERPDEPRALFLLGMLPFLQDRASEDKSALERLEINPAWAAVATKEIGWQHFWANRWEMADAAADRSIAMQPYWDNLGLKIELARLWHGDLDLAKRLLDRIPSSALQEDSTVSRAITVLWWRRDANAMIALLDTHPREWIHHAALDGPKAFFMGQARLLAKQPGAAERDFRRALELIELRLAGEPNDLSLLGLKAMTLHHLGATAEAAQVYRLARELGDPGTHLTVLFEPPETALAALEAQTGTEFNFTSAWPVYATAASLRLDPALDSLRESPRFVALLARAEADPRKSPNAHAAPDAKNVSSVDQESAPADKSVAVLAFANLSDDKDNEYFSDGISEELLNVLAKVPGLKVTARTSAFFFKDKQVPIAEIAQQLGVAYVVEGSVRKQGDRVRISAQLIRAATNELVWSSGSLDRNLQDIFAVQDEIAGLIASNLSLKMGVSSSGSETVNPAAFELYLEGRQAWRLRTEAGFEQAERLFNQALAIDPKFARAYVGLADVWLVRNQNENAMGAFDQRVSPILAKIEAAVQKALELNPDLAEAHATLGSVRWMEWRFEDGIRELRRAVILNPSYISGHQWLGRVYLSTGQMDEALEQLKLAHELDPLYARVADNHAQALIAAQRPQEALAALDQALAVQPDSNQALRMKAVALAELGRYEEAITTARLYLDRGADAGVNFVAYALARAGARTEAARTLADTDSSRPDSPWLAASLALDETDVFDQDIAVGGIKAQPLELLYFWPVFDAVREKPAFVRMLQTLGITQAHARAQAWRAAHPPEKPDAKR